MEAWATLASQLLVRTALAAVPLALIVAALCRWMPSRPATRHTLWLVLIAWFLVSPMLPGVAIWNALAAKWATRGDETLVALKPPQTSLDRNDVDIDVRELLPERSESTDVSIDPVASVVQIEPIAPVALDPPIETLVGRPDFSFRSIAQRATATIRDALNQLSEHIVAVVPSGSADRRSATRSMTPAVRIPADESIAATDEPPVIANPPVDSAEVDASAAASRIDSTPTPVTIDVESKSTRWSEWTAWLRVARDAVVRLPAIPPAVIFSGMAMIVCGHALRMLLFCRRLRQTVKTPPSVIALVQRCARQIGLRKMPLVQMTADNVSPMIWCGWRSRLILPMPLWSQLDAVGREAIVCHELAHLRRRDHWWCWGDLLAGVVYWWHPLVWWVRRRLHEEAELSCDAWVVWLLPHGRRAYAEALLRTKENVGRAYPVGPAVGMAVASGRGRQFARRLTMVMTQSTRPRMSFAGLALAAVIAAAGWAAVPARSCPPETSGGKPETVPTVAVVAPTPPEAPDAPDAPDAPEAPAAPDAPESPSVVAVVSSGAMPVGVIAAATACPPGESPSVGQGTSVGGVVKAKRGKKLGITGASGDLVVVEPGHVLATTIRPGQAGAWMANGNDRIAQLERRVAELTARVDELSARGGPGSRYGVSRTPAPPRSPMPPPPMEHGFAPRAAGDAGNQATIVRTYKLPKGKLDALVGLMSRSDVPTSVRAINGGIEVHATQAQHEVFEAFVRLINPEGGQKPRADAADVAASERLHAQAAARQERAAALRARLKAIEERTRAVSAERKTLLEARQRQIEQLREQADQIREHADSIRQKADGAGDEGEVEKDKARSLRDHAKELEKQAKSLEKEMGKLEHEAGDMESLGEALEEETEALGCLHETLGELHGADLAKLLREASQSVRGDAMQQLRVSLASVSEAIESDMPAKLDEALKSLDVSIEQGAPRVHSKALERLCETLREKAEQIEALAEVQAEKAEADAAGTRH